VYETRWNRSRSSEDGLRWSSWKYRRWSSTGRAIGHPGERSGALFDAFFVTTHTHTHTYTHIIVLLSSLYYTEFSRTKYTVRTIILYAHIFFHLCLGVQTNVYRLLTEFRLTHTHTHTHTHTYKTNLAAGLWYRLVSIVAYYIPWNRGQYTYLSVMYVMSRDYTVASKIPLRGWTSRYLKVNRTCHPRVAT